MASFETFNPTCEECEFCVNPFPPSMDPFGYCNKELGKMKRILRSKRICKDAIPKERS